jgi:hypothetical protein
MRFSHLLVCNTLIASSVALPGYGQNQNSDPTETQPIVNLSLNFGGGATEAHSNAEHWNKE